MLLQRKGEEKKEWGSDNVSSKQASNCSVSQIMIDPNEGTMETLDYVEK